MEQKKQFAKLKELKEFRIQSIIKVYYQRWIDGNFEKSDTPKQGFQKYYIIDCGVFLLSISAFQFKDLLMLCFDDIGTANILHKTFLVSNNAKMGKDCRYFFKLKQVQEQIEEPPMPEDDIPNDLPF